MTIARAIARTWTDADYKAKMMNDPRAALAEAGVEVPAGMTVKVLEDTVEIEHLVLPVAPDSAGEVSFDDLQKIAAGGGPSNY